MMWTIRGILRYLAGAPTQKEIDAIVETAKVDAAQKGRDEALDTYTLELDKLRKGMLTEQELERKESRLEERLGDLKAQEKKISNLSDEIRLREITLVLDYAKTLSTTKHKLDSCFKGDFILWIAQREEWKLSAVKRDFFNNFAYLDDKLGESRGYKLLAWTSDTLGFPDKSGEGGAVLGEIATLLRYFRAQADEKKPEEIAVKVDKCISEPKYYASIKGHAQKKIEQIDALHKTYAGDLDKRAKDLLTERGPRGSFETMITESRTGDVALVVGRDSTASRIGLLRELDTYEKENNINLYDYLN